MQCLPAEADAVKIDAKAPSPAPTPAAAPITASASAVAAATAPSSSAASSPSSPAAPASGFGGRAAESHREARRGEGAEQVHADQGNRREHARGKSRSTNRTFHLVLPPCAERKRIRNFETSDHCVCSAKKGSLWISSEADEICAMHNSSRHLDRDVESGAAQLKARAPCAASRGRRAEPWTRPSIAPGRAPTRRSGPKAPAPDPGGDRR